MTETFSILPAGPRPLWILVPVCLVVLVAFAPLAAAWYGSQHASVEVSPAGLRLRGDVYARLIPSAHLDAGAARVVDLRAVPEYQPTRRTLGTALPGYAAGWFRLRNGEKALLFLTDRSNVVYVPTRDGYAVLLSPARPHELVRALQALARGT